MDDHPWSHVLDRPPLRRRHRLWPFAILVGAVTLTVIVGSGVAWVHRFNRSKVVDGALSIRIASLNGKLGPVLDLKPRRLTIALDVRTDGPAAINCRLPAGAVVKVEANAVIPFTGDLSPGSHHRRPTAAAGLDQVYHLRYVYSGPYPEGSVPVCPPGGAFRAIPDDMGWNPVITFIAENSVETDVNP